MALYKVTILFKQKKTLQKKMGLEVMFESGQWWSVVNGVREVVPSPWSGYSEVCVSIKNAPTLASCSFDKHGLILIIFGKYLFIMYSYTQYNKHS